ncbi:MAG: hypothetical protein QXO21_04880, partial [Candidatus Anstonellales archaeon]
MHKLKKVAVFLIISLVVVELSYAPVKSFEFIGEVRAWWTHTNNAWDKTETIVRNDGSADFDDVNDNMFSDTKLGVRASILR